MSKTPSLYMTFIGNPPRNDIPGLELSLRMGFITMVSKYYPSAITEEIKSLSAHKAIRAIAKEIGYPHEIHQNQSNEVTLQKLMDYIRQQKT